MSLQLRSSFTPLVHIHNLLLKSFRCRPLNILPQSLNKLDKKSQVFYPVAQQLRAQIPFSIQLSASFTLSFNTRSVMPMVCGKRMMACLNFSSIRL
jgi:hypothetical protein